MERSHVWTWLREINFRAPRMPPTPSTTFSRRFAKFLDDGGFKKMEMMDLITAMISVKCSSKSELSSRFCGRLEFSGSNLSETLNGRLPLEDGSDRRETLPKRVSDDLPLSIFRRRKKFWRFCLVSETVSRNFPLIFEELYEF